jgi:hypothetical protein
MELLIIVAATIDTLTALYFTTKQNWAVSSFFLEYNSSIIVVKHNNILSKPLFKSLV